MKIKLTFLIAVIMFFSSQLIAQNNSLEISSKNVVYTRKAKDIPDHKKTFEVNYPVISGVSDNKNLKTLESSISYWKNFKTTLEENINEHFWLYALDYKVNYNKRGILDVSLYMEGSGAYPSTVIKNLVIDTKTGNRVFIAETFTNIGKLLVKIDKMQQVEMKKAAKIHDVEVEYYEEVLARGYANKISEFSVSDKGVTFIFDWGFPHVAKATEPEGRYFFSWEKIKPHIKRDGLLGKFVS